MVVTTSITVWIETPDSNPFGTGTKQTDKANDQTLRGNEIQFDYLVVGYPITIVDVVANVSFSGMYLMN